MTDPRDPRISEYLNASYMRRVLVLVRHRQGHPGSACRSELLTRSLMAEVQDWIPPRLYHALRRRVEAWMEEHIVAEEIRACDARNKRVRALAEKVRSGEALDHSPTIPAIGREPPGEDRPG